MQLIIGHTTDDSSLIWVRGDRRNRRLVVAIERPGYPAPGRPKSVARSVITVDRERDYTDVVRFDGVLKPDKLYKVVLRPVGSFRMVHGQLRTFPEEGAATSFRFLHGSCNLPTARLTALGSTAIGLLGAASTNNALKLPFADWDTHLLRPCFRWVSWPGIRRITRLAIKLMNYAVLRFTRQTRFEQPDLKLLPSPFEQICERIVDDEAAVSRPAFMIHCGDQIYFDVDFPERRDVKEDYWRNYRQAWFEDEATKNLLRELPHYMILDDHEIVDNFGTEPDGDTAKFKEPALAAYDQYVAARQPPPPDGRKGRYYTFDHGDTSFFVLDTRTDRSSEHARMISVDQLEALDKWLVERSGLKFIVSSVPFVAELRPPGLDSNGERHEDERSDKWSGDAWQEQRKHIIRTIYDKGVQRVVFLVGDMHCTYHARMQIGEPRQRLTVHELAGGPINQVLFAKRDQFYERYSSTFDTVVTGDKGEKKKVSLPWTSTLEAFHGSSPSVLEIAVRRESENAPPEVNWKALPTHPGPAARSGVPNLAKPCDPDHLCGRIRFHRLRGEIA